MVINGGVYFLRGHKNETYPYKMYILFISDLNTHGNYQVLIPLKRHEQNVFKCEGHNVLDIVVNRKRKEKERKWKD